VGSHGVPSVGSSVVPHAPSAMGLPGGLVRGYHRQMNLEEAIHLLVRPALLTLQCGPRSTE